MRKGKCLTVIVKSVSIGSSPERASLYTESDPDDDGTFFINVRNIGAGRKKEDLLGLQVVRFNGEWWEVIT